MANGIEVGLDGRRSSELMTVPVKRLRSGRCASFEILRWGDGKAIYLCEYSR